MPRKRGLSAAHSRAVTPVAVTSAARVGAVRPGPGSSPLAGSLRLCADVHGRTGDPLHVEEEVSCLLAAVVHGPAAAVLGAVVCGGVGFAGEAHLRPGQGGRGVAAHLEDVLGSVAHLAVVAEGDARAATSRLEEGAFAWSDFKASNWVFPRLSCVCCALSCVLRLPSNLQKHVFEENDIGTNLKVLSILKLSS